MADAGKTRISIFNKIKTKINSSASDPNLPELTGMMLQNRILVGQKMNTDSGEALLYYASDTHDADRECIVKLYRRRNSVKHGVLEKLVLSTVRMLPGLYAAEKLTDMPILSCLITAETV